MLNRKLVTSGTWRVDPITRTRVIDHFGRTVANTLSEADASIIATAPDMYQLIESMDDHEAMPSGLWEEIQHVLRRARGELGLAFSCCGTPQTRQARGLDWLKFIERLWNPES